MERDGGPGTEPEPTGRQRARGCRVVATLLVALVVALVSGACTRDVVTLGFGPSDVEHVEVFLYAYGQDVSEVARSTITDRVEVAELVQAFTDVPVRRLRHDADQVRGAGAAGLRFALRDGTDVELTQVYVAPKDVVLVWPDGRTASTTYGADISLYGTPADPDANELVDAEQRPRAVIG